jgi:hypothetical protein
MLHRFFHLNLTIESEIILRNLDRFYSSSHTFLIHDIISKPQSNLISWLVTLRTVLYTDFPNLEVFQKAFKSFKGFKIEGPQRAMKEVEG